MTIANNPAEKLNRDLDTLTPLDPRNSLLLSGEQQKRTHQRGDSDEPLAPYHDETLYDTSYRGPGGYSDNINLPTRPFRDDRQPSPNPSMRQPLLPDIDMTYRSRGY